MSKLKLKPRIVGSRDAMQAAVADIVKNKLIAAEILATMEQEIARVQSKYQDTLAELYRQIECDEAGAQVWAEKNRSEFGEKKSIELVMAIVGFRTTPHRVEKRNSRDTWGKIARRLQAAVWGESYIREPDPEVNKQQLLTDRAKLTPQQLIEVGISFEQDEDFFIEPKSQVLQSSVKEVS